MGAPGSAILSDTEVNEKDSIKSLHLTSFQKKERTPEGVRSSLPHKVRYLCRFFHRLLDALAGQDALSDLLQVLDDKVNPLRVYIRVQRDLP